MDLPSAEGILDAGGAVEAEGSAGGEGGGGSGEGDAVKKFTTPSQRPPTSRRQFRTPQAIRTGMPVENSKVQLPEFPPVQDSYAYVTMEGEADSTASSPQPPLPRDKGHSSVPAGVRNVAISRATPSNRVRISPKKPEQLPCSMSLCSCILPSFVV